MKKSAFYAGSALPALFFLISKIQQNALPNTAGSFPFRQLPEMTSPVHVPEIFMREAHDVSVSNAGLREIIATDLSDRGEIPPRFDRREKNILMPVKQMVTLSQNRPVGQITRDPSTDYHTKWPPDRERNAFDDEWKGRPNIFSFSPGSGKAKRLGRDGTVDARPCWPPDCSRIPSA